MFTLQSGHVHRDKTGFYRGVQYPYKIKFYRGVQIKWNFIGGTNKMEFYRGGGMSNGILQWKGPDKTGFNSGFRQDEILQRAPDKMKFHRGVHTKFNFTGVQTKWNFAGGPLRARHVPILSRRFVNS